jgi:hypothetical protein
MRRCVQRPEPSCRFTPFSRSKNSSHKRRPLGRGPTCPRPLPRPPSCGHLLLEVEARRRRSLERDQVNRQRPPGTAARRPGGVMAPHTGGPAESRWDISGSGIEASSGESAGPSAMGAAMARSPSKSSVQAKPKSATKTTQARIRTASGLRAGRTATSLRADAFSRHRVLPGRVEVKRFRAVGSAIEEIAAAAPITAWARGTGAPVVARKPGTRQLPGALPT